MRDGAEHRSGSEADSFGATRCCDAEGVSDESFHCATCADEGVPMRVVEVREGGTALCLGEVEVMTDLVGPVEPGDGLLVHAGVALQRVDGRRLDEARQGAEGSALPAPERGQA